MPAFLEHVHKSQPSNYWIRQLRSRGGNGRGPGPETSHYLREFQSFKSLDGNVAAFDATRKGLNLSEGGCHSRLEKKKPGIALVDWKHPERANHISGPSRTGGLFRKTAKTCLPVKLLLLITGRQRLITTRWKQSLFPVQDWSHSYLQPEAQFGHTLGGCGHSGVRYCHQALEQGLVLPSSRL